MEILQHEVELEPNSHHGDTEKSEGLTTKDTKEHKGGSGAGGDGNRVFRPTCPNRWCHPDSKMLELEMVVKFDGLKFQDPEKDLAASKGVYE